MGQFSCEVEALQQRPEEIYGYDLDLFVYGHSYTEPYASTRHGTMLLMSYSTIIPRGITVDLHYRQSSPVHSVWYNISYGMYL